MRSEWAWSHPRQPGPAMAGPGCLRVGDQRDDATRAVRSISWQVYPYSLSYQPMIFTVLPMDFVSGASKVQAAGEVMMSVETMGSVEYTTRPCSGPAAAARNASLTSSTSAAR